MNQSPTIAALAGALARAQGKFLPIRKAHDANYTTRGGGKMSYDFADLGAVLASVRPGLSKNGLALLTPVQPQLEGETPRATATIRLIHESGEWIEESFTVPIIDPMDPRSIGSASTYAKRYGVLGLLGIHPAEEDDDGEQARGGDFEQARQTVQRQAPAARPQRETVTQPDPEEQARAQEKARATAKQMERDARDVQIREGALSAGVESNAFRGWVERVLGHTCPAEAGWNRSWTDAERGILEDEVRAQRELVGKPIPVAHPKAKASGRRGPVEDLPPRTMTVIDEVSGTTRTVSSTATPVS